MTTQLSSLRVSAEMESTKYVAGMNAKIAADKAGAASSAAVGQAVTQTDQKISQAGDVLSRLSRQYVDGYASAQRMNAAVNQLSRGIDTGKISMQQAEPILEGIFRKYGQLADGAQFAVKGQYEFATAITATTARLTAQAAAANAASASVTRVNAAANQNMGQPAYRGAANFNASNAAFQMQDIAMMAAMGQAPMATALQQGPQLAMIMQQGGGLPALAAGLTSLVSPIMLITVGMTAAAAASIQYFTKSRSEAKTIDEVLKDHEAQISRIKDIWGEAADASEKYGKRSTAAASFGFEMSAANLRKSLREQVTPGVFSSGPAIEAILKATGDNLADIGGPRAFRETSMFKALQFDLSALVEAAKDGEPDILGLTRRIAELGASSGNKGIRNLADDIVTVIGPVEELARKLVEANNRLKELFNSVGPNGMVLSQGPIARGDMGNLAAFEAQQSVSRQRQQQMFAAETQSMRAKSPAELAAAARAREAATFSDDETAQARRDRIELAGKRALIEAEHDLAEAQKERNRSLDATMASMQLDIQLVGKSTAETERLRMEHELLSDLREEAARNNVAVDEAEVRRIREKAEEYGKLRAIEEARTSIKSGQDQIEMARAELSVSGETSLVRARVIEQLKVEQEIRRLGIDLYGQEATAMRENAAALSGLAETMARAKLQQDLLFERSQILRSEQDQQIASMLRGAGLPVDLNSQEAGMIRYNMRLKETKETFKGFVNDLVSGLREGKSLWESFANAAVNALQKIADKLLDRGIDGILNSLLGGGTGTSSGGGFDLGGIVGSLFGGGGSASKTAANSNDPWGGTRGAANDNFAAPLGAVTRGGGGAVDLASSLFGLSENTNAGTINSFLKSGGVDLDAAQTAWCAAFVNSSLKQIGVDGTGSNVANSFLDWGTKIDASKVLRGDVLVKPNGFGLDQTGGHVGLATGVTRMGENGLQLEMLSGNTGGKGLGTGGVGTDWIDATKLDVRRAGQEVAGFGSVATEAAKNLGGFSGGLGQLAQSLMSVGSIATGPGGGNWFSGLMGMFGGAGGAMNWMNSISPAATSFIAGGGVGLFHGGGIAGYPTQMRYGVDSRVFAGASRYHNGGLAGDEVPAILRRGEPVFKSMAHAREVVGVNSNAERPAQNINQTNNFIFRENPATPASQNQIAAKSAERLQRLTRTA